MPRPKPRRRCLRPTSDMVERPSRRHSVCHQRLQDVGRPESSRATRVASTPVSSPPRPPANVHPAKWTDYIEGTSPMAMLSVVNLYEKAARHSHPPLGFGGEQRIEVGVEVALRAWRLGAVHQFGERRTTSSRRRLGITPWAVGVCDPLAVTPLYSWHASRA